MTDNIKETEENIDVKENNIKETIEPVKVQIAEKKKFDYFSIVRWIVGLYIIGLLLNLNTKVLQSIAEFIYTKIMPSNFLTIELVDFAAALREPLVPLILTIPFFIPTAIVLIITNFILNLINVFPGKQKKVYLTIMATLLLLSSTTAFMYS